jgi:hypothetical protein
MTKLLFLLGLNPNSLSFSTSCNIGESGDVVLPRLRRRLWVAVAMLLDSELMPEKALMPQIIIKASLGHN